MLRNTNYAYNYAADTLELTISSHGELLARYI